MSRCSDCVHDGCCEYPCGGSSFESRWAECVCCGTINDYSDMELIDDEYVCYHCVDKYTKERNQK